MWHTDCGDRTLEGAALESYLMSPPASAMAPTTPPSRQPGGSLLEEPEQWP